MNISLNLKQYPDLRDDFTLEDLGYNVSNYGHSDMYFPEYKRIVDATKDLVELEFYMFQPPSGE